MRTIVLTAALLCSAAAFAQTYPDTSTTTTTTTTEPAPATDPATSTTTTTTTDTSATTTTTAAAAPTTEMGPTTKVLAKGDHYAVHRVLPDGTVMVKVLTGEDAQMAMAGKQPAALAAFMSAQPLTAGAGTSMPAQQPMTQPAPEPTPQQQPTEPEPETQPQPQPQS
jgi:hypothetical protein